MQLSFSSDQDQLGDSVRRMLADHYGFQSRRRFLAEPAAWREPAWAQFAALGLTALGVPAEHGGLGGDARALLPVLREFGRALVVEPFVGSCVLGARAVALAGTPAQAAALLPGVAEGALRLAFAGEDTGTRNAGAHGGLRATQAGGAWRLSGMRPGVQHAQSAHRLVLLASDDHGEAALFVVEGEAARRGSRHFRLFDGTSASDLVLQDVPAERLDGAGWAQVAPALRRLGMAAACAETLGVADMAVAVTREYVNTRQQFGRALAANQAVRHRFADMRVAHEMIESAAMLAAIVADDPDSVEDADADAASAKLVAARHGRALCEDAVQLHGGVGMTEECAVGHGLRRVLVLEQSFGDADHHLRRLAGALSL